MSSSSELPQLNTTIILTLGPHSHIHGYIYTHTHTPTEYHINAAMTLV